MNVLIGLAEWIAIVLVCYLLTGFDPVMWLYEHWPRSDG